MNKNRVEIIRRCFQDALEVPVEGKLSDTVVGTIAASFYLEETRCLEETRGEEDPFTAAVLELGDMMSLMLQRLDALTKKVEEMANGKPENGGK